MQVTACLSGDLVGLPIQRRRLIHAAFCRSPPSASAIVENHFSLLKQTGIKWNGMVFSTIEHGSGSCFSVDFSFAPDFFLSFSINLSEAENYG